MSVKDARVSVTLAEHPKTKKLIRRHGQAAAWNLVRLFLHAAANRPDGDLSGMDDDDIEIAADWLGDPGAFVAALIEVRFLDGEAGSYCIHDWNEHNPWAAQSDMRADRARWANLVRHHGPGEAARLMPEYADRTGAGRKSDPEPVLDPPNRSQAGECRSPEPESRSPNHESGTPPYLSSPLLSPPTESIGTADAVAADPEPAAAEPKPRAKRESKPAITLRTFRAAGGLLVQVGEDPLLAYCDRIGLPEDFLRLAAHAFDTRFKSTDQKQRDWPAHFRNAVYANWFKLWWDDGGTWRLTTQGKQAERELQALAAEAAA
jgi:hypothetical protein